MRRPVRKFCFRLAALLGCTVRELERRLDVFELMEWMAYDQLEPFGEGRLVLQNAMQMRMKIPSDAGVDIEDLVPYLRRVPATELDDDQREELEARMKRFFKSKAGINGN